MRNQSCLIALTLLLLCSTACNGSAGVNESGAAPDPQSSGGGKATRGSTSTGGLGGSGGTRTSATSQGGSGAIGGAPKATTQLTSGGGTNTAGGARSVGGATSSGGTNTLAGTRSVGGATSSGGTNTLAGARSAGGATSSSSGGTNTLAGARSAGGATSSSSGGTNTAGGAASPFASEIEFAPYFYTWGWGNAAYPFLGLADLKAKSGVVSATLAFVLSNGTCAATTDIRDHQSDVTAFLALGGHVKASFGGANGTYLENACTDVQSLANAISSFVDTTGIADLDFDVEQAGAMDATINTRRAQALKLVQTARNVAVSYTLAATPRDKWGTPGGLSAASLAVVRATLDAQVKISRVNLMTMDYGSYYSSGNAMGALAVSALTDAATQLQTLIAGLSESDAWHMLGATPMIGQNDTAGEIFTPEDALTLVAFAKEKHLGLLSFWAINRDQPCPYEDLGVCSKVNTKNFEFSAIFSGAR